MATITTNLGLTKPAGTDYVDISVINTNMDLIDAAVHRAQNASSTSYTITSLPTGWEE
jgi:hypothetical protein